MTPGTVEHFIAWASRLTLDNGEKWLVEPWQERIVADILAGKPIIWVLVPEGNGKTTLMAGVALYHLDVEGAGLTAPRAVIAAASAKQAKWLYDQAEVFVIGNPDLQARFKCLGGFKEIRRQEGIGKLEIFAQDDRTADGAIFTLAIVDELHNHRDLRLYRRWVGKLWKRDGQVVTISTAGDPASEFEEARTRIVKQAQKVETDGAYTFAESDDIILHQWQLAERSMCEDMAEVAKANPLASITAETLARKRADPTITIEHWLRFTCNLPTRVEGQAINPEDWDALAEEDLQVNPATWAIGGIDLGWEIDCTGLIVLSWESQTRRIVSGIRILEPPVDESDIVKGLVDLQRELKPKMWVFDPNASGKQMVQMLEKGTHPDQGDVEFKFAEHSQSNAPMALAAARLDEAIRAKWLVHDGHEVLRKHALAAVKLPVHGDQFRYDRPPGAKDKAARMKSPIDGLTALSFAHSIAVAEHERVAVPLIARR